MSKSCSESSSTCILCLCEGEVVRTYRLVGAFATRHEKITIISCADQFIVQRKCGYKFIVDNYLIFLFNNIMIIE